MNILLRNAQLTTHNSQLQITGSKSETNRLLLLQALYPNIVLENTSNSDDSQVMLKAIQHSTSHAQHPIRIDVHHAGTAMRFLTAYFAIQEGKEVVLTGSSRMKERPIRILVDALRQLGATITYEENEGFPPIRISGSNLKNAKVSLAANVSSQYISALLLIAPKLNNGLIIELEGEITSIPYIEMTLALLNEIGITTLFEQNTIEVHPFTIGNQPQLITIESDWSSASYFYEIVALSAVGTTLTLSSYKPLSLQGDAALVSIYKNFGVATIFNNDNSITIIKSTSTNSKELIANLQASPDIAQTIAVTCFGLGIACHLTGLHTLKIKETDRLEALQIELTKLGATISVSNDSLTLEAFAMRHDFSNQKVATYQDHRMAMAFAPLALKASLIIQEAEVVSKSYPNFWKDLSAIGFQISEIQ